ncbi:uncharacterized protein LOC123714295 [Pieris brassicae]|uniref:Uncharacterized protein n=1 Tax=Pieris brassicae TaxID=7116 RepID=A0A9P0T174_PIEBR|nr:uncharacterized protein LOC123714295 [Pieris brassicae]CAH3962998.1 unnamed protein product [Pieris brassicae]
MIKNFVLFAALCALVTGNTLSVQDFIKAASAGDFKTLRKFINPNFAFDNFPGQPNLNTDVASLQPGPGAHVFGQAESSFSSYSNNNGQVSTESGGYGLINKDGVVSSYSFTPKNLVTPNENIPQN